jgi:hypothetical protein
MISGDKGREIDGAVLKADLYLNSKNLIKIFLNESAVDIFKEDI